MTTAFSTSTLAAERAGPIAASTPATAAATTYSASCDAGHGDLLDALALSAWVSASAEPDARAGAERAPR